MRKRYHKQVGRLSILLLIIFCTGLVGAEIVEPVLNVAFVWHQHQPLYLDPTTGFLELPWVRMHAIKDYFDMAAIFADYPDLRATFNLVPILLEQLVLYTEGDLIDKYQLMAQIPADQLQDWEKEFLLWRFFDANWDNIIARFPRYEELLDKRGRFVTNEVIASARERYSDQDYLDLQCWFNLAWFDPDFHTEDPELAELVRQERNFSEADKELIHRKQVEIIRQVVQVHRELQEQGQIELITTPYSHPILPLLYSSELAQSASPGLNVPVILYSWPEDIARHLERSLVNYHEYFHGQPKGLWPSEQAVSKYIVPYVAKAGFEWMLSSEGVLEKSLGFQLRGIDGIVGRPELLYQPYLVEWEGEQVAILFRDIVLSDRVGFEYSGLNGAVAAKDFLDYLHSVRLALGDQADEKVVVIALDGENAWEHYPNDGKEFLAALYSGLAEDPLLRTVTVSEYLAEHPPTESLEDLWTGSWIASNLETWIGEEEENLAWESLALAREVLADFEKMHGEDLAYQESLTAAWQSMLAAQGSDWFWWYGDDQDSNNDAAFDALFRSHLQGVYQSLGLEPPWRLSFPLLDPVPAKPVQPLTSLGAPAIDGWANFGEWAGSAMYTAPFDASLQSLYAAIDYQELTLRFDFYDQARNFIGEQVELYVYFDRVNQGPVNQLTCADATQTQLFLGYSLGHKLHLNLATAPKGIRPEAIISQARGLGEEESWSRLITVPVGVGEVLEMAIPFEKLGYEPGDAVRFTVLLAQNGIIQERLPSDGPVVLRVPRPTEGTLVFRLEDPSGDDYGPGTYIYPTDDVFPEGVFDLTEFAVYETENDVVFHVQFAGPVDNVWDSPNGLSVQTIDIYLDTDGVQNSGSTEALAGRRVNIAPESAWEYAIWVEGWHQKLFTADGSEAGVNVRVVTDSLHNKVIIQVPKDAIGRPGEQWGYLVLIMGQEGFPASDSLRVREVMKHAQEWRFGGGHDGVFDSNVLDLLALPGKQEKMLSTYDPMRGVLAEVEAVYEKDLMQ